MRLALALAPDRSAIFDVRNARLTGEAVVFNINNGNTLKFTAGHDALDLVMHTLYKHEAVNIRTPETFTSTVFGSVVLDPEWIAASPVRDSKIYQMLETVRPSSTPTADISRFMDSIGISLASVEYKKSLLGFALEIKSEKKLEFMEYEKEFICGIGIDSGRKLIQSKDELYDTIRRVFGSRNPSPLVTWASCYFAMFRRQLKELSMSSIVSRSIPVCKIRNDGGLVLCTDLDCGNSPEKPLRMEPFEEPYIYTEEK